MIEDLSKGIRFGVVPTYRCNLRCDMCNRRIDKFPWQESDLAVEDVQEAGKLLKEAGLKINKVRVTGGEPTLHPQLREIVDVIATEWGVVRWTHVLTNGTTVKTRPSDIKAKYSGGPKISTDFKLSRHHPFSISPADLGLQGDYGTKYPCEQQSGCGRLFDAFGFSFCVLAGSLGRLLRIDPYSETPILEGDPRICKHCIFSIGRKMRWRIWGRWRQGLQDGMTPTYKVAEDAFRLLPFRFKRWKERP